MEFSMIDFFAGVGGIKKGILYGANKNNIKINSIGFSDIKKESCFIYPKLWNEENNLGDITKININKLENFDIFLGGFPCQSYSMAGKRLGLKDQRGQLIYNIFDIVDKKKPKILFLENVNGILTIDKGKTIKEIINKFKKLGYIIKYFPLNSKDFGVPQSRQRVYFIGFHKDFINEKQGSPILNRIEKKILEKKEKIKKYTLKNILETKGINGLEKFFLNDKQFKMVLLRDSFCGSLKGIDDISNGITKTYNKISGQSTKIVFDTNKKKYLNKNEIKELYLKYKEESKELKELKKEIKKKKLSKEDRIKKLNIFFKKIILPANLITRIYTPLELGRIQGYDDNFIKILINNIDSLKYLGIASLLGDSVSVPVIKELSKIMFEEIKNIKEI